MDTSTVRRASPWVVTAAVGAFAAVLVALEASDAALAVHAPGVTKPDLLWGYDHDRVVAVLAALGPAGRRSYLVNLAIDTAMPLLAMTATVLVVARAWPRLLRPLSVAPIAFAVLDVLENAAFAVMVRQFPDVATGLVAATSPVTVAKLVAFWFATLPTLVGGLAVLGVRWVRRRGVDPRNRGWWRGRHPA